MTEPRTDIPMVCTVCRQPVEQGSQADLWFHADSGNPANCSRTVPVKATAAASGDMPVVGDKGQQLCDGCRPCQLGYHCGPCHKAWLERAVSRSQMKAHRNRKRHRKGLPQ